MALSLLSHSSAELQSFFDPLRISLDYSFSDQMEFSSLATVNNNIQNTTNNRNYTEIQQNQVTNRNNFNDYEQVISFVDSPPNSKESWPGDYPKIVDVQTIYAINSGRKRRMDWEALEISQGATNSSPSDAKAPNLGTKDREKKKLQGRGSWTDDIDFDLNGEFTNNGYLNNEAFLSLSSALTVLKQEIPSPNSDAQQKGCKSPRDNQQQQKTIINDDHDKKQKLDHTTNAANAGTIGNFQQVLQQQQQQQQQQTQPQQQQQQQPTPQQQSQQNSLEHNSANNSPSHSDVTKTDTSLDDYKFQYVLAAATSIATKSNEETLTYLNQGQSYEIKLKKIGDLTFYRGKVLKSVIKICFHERRLQYMEREQMQQWQASRPGERIIEVDVPLSYGLCHASQPLNPNLLNTVEVLWDPMKEVGVYIKVNCISTEFTPKKHGGEKGVPFRIQIETYLEQNNDTNTINKPIHAAACQIKVFKLKGADRKHKQDREKIQRRPPSEQEKYQPSYECTILSDIPSDSIIQQQQGCYSPEYIDDDDDDDESLQELENNFDDDDEKEYVETTKEFMNNNNNNIHGQHNIPIDHNNLQTLPSALIIDNEKSNEINADIANTLRNFTTELLKNEQQKLTLRKKKLQLMAERNNIMKSIKPTVSPMMPNSPVHIPKYDGIMQFSTNNNPSPAGIGNVNSSNTNNFKQIEQNLVSPQQQVDMEEYVKSAPITKDSTTVQVAQWLTYHRLNLYVGTFTHFSGSDILRMSKEDLIQICGLADGIRMFNTLHAKAITPRLTIYVSLDGNSYNAVYLISNTVKELTQKLFKLPGFYELCANNNANVSGVDGNSFSGWGLNSKYSGSGSNLYDASKLSVYVNGPNGIQVLVTDEVLNNIKDDSLFTIEFQNNGKILMKASYNNKNETN